MNKEKLDLVLENHKSWLIGNGGERANLTGANLSYANLSNADLSNADLSNANLSYANLSYADLSNANLTDANLSNAKLASANLTDANLRWADSQDVVGQTVVSVQVDTSRNNNQISYWKDLNVWTTGCFRGTLEELKASIETTHKDNDKMRIKYYKVIEFILEMSEC